MATFDPSKVLQSGASQNTVLSALKLAALRPTWQGTAYASPPTITPNATGNAASSISGAVQIAWDDPRLTYSTRVVVYGEFQPHQAKPAYMDIGASGSPANMGGMLTSYSFGTEDTVFEIKGRGFSQHRVWVQEDQTPARACPIQTMPSTGEDYLTKYEFAGGRKPRTIMVQFTSGLCGPIVGPTASVYKAAFQTPKILLSGDSFLEGAGAADNYLFNGFGYQLGQLLGCFGTTIAVGLGSTGYIANQGGARKNAAEIVVSSVVDNAPDVVIHCHGLNDGADVTTNASLVFDTIRNALPNCLQIVFLPFQPRSITGISTRRTELLTVAASRPWLTVIDNTTFGTDPEITGTGRVGSTSGSGNSDWVTSDDGTHPTAEGHTHIAFYRAAKIRAALGIA